MDEFELIARYFAPLAAGTEGAFGLKDDAAQLNVAAGRALVLTKDVLAAGVHFSKDEPPSLVARKALRVNLSDLAAKGAAPRGYLLGLGLPGDVTEDWLEAFSSGLSEDQSAFDITLFGGDTFRAADGPVISVTMFGTVPKDEGMIRRAGARAGNLVFVSGTLGDAAMGFRALEADPQASGYLVDRLQLPSPRVELGIALRGHVSAMADISDGLVADLGHIAEASDVAAVVDIDRVPLSDAARARAEDPDDLLKTAVSWGDDYELVFTAPAARKDPVLALSKGLNARVTLIGEVRAGAGVELRAADDTPVELEATGYKHFS